MERSNTDKERRNKQKSSSKDIIPQLPDEVALCILARLPRSLQRHRRLICHAWKDAMEAASMTSLRKALNISEEWPVFVSGIDRFLFTIGDPVQQCRRSIPLPKELEQQWNPTGSMFFFKVIGAIGSKVLVAGASGLAEEGCTPDMQGVYSFDALSMKWGDSKYSLLPNSLSLQLHSRYASAADADGGYLYVARGFVSSRTLRERVERLDTKTRTWETLPDPHVKREDAAGFVLQGLFHLIGGAYNHTPDGNCIRYEIQRSSGEIWDPATRQWTLVPELWPSEIFGGRFEKQRVAALKDTLYTLRRISMADELMYYDSVSKSWTSLGCVPLDLSSSYQYTTELGTVRLLGMGQELWVIDRRTMECVATKPTLSQPFSWRTLPCTFKRALPLDTFCSMVAVLRV